MSKRGPQPTPAHAPIATDAIHPDDLNIGDTGKGLSVSAPFIRRPVATSLLTLACVLAGWLGYLWLPVASLPQVDFPTIQITTQLPGANPDTMSNLVTAPLERQFGQIPALSTMTSSSSYGISQITLQFSLDRDIDAAAQDVQAAITAAGSTLPRNLPYPPLYAVPAPALRSRRHADFTTPRVRLRRRPRLRGGRHQACHPHPS
jgi:multidrug efflux pump